MVKKIISITLVLIFSSALSAGAQGYYSSGSYYNCNCQYSGYNNSGYYYSASSYPSATSYYTSSGGYYVNSQFVPTNSYYAPSYGYTQPYYGYQSYPSTQMYSTGPLRLQLNFNFGSRRNTGYSYQPSYYPWMY